MGAENSRECKKSIRFSEIQSTYSGGNHDGVGQIGFSSSQSRLPFSTNAQSWRSLLAGTLVWISNTRLQSARDPDQVHILNQNSKQSTKFNVQTIFLINCVEVAWLLFSCFDLKPSEAASSRHWTVPQSLHAYYCCSAKC